jgi:enoyl-CoA hydratase/carnithine racemase
VAELERERRGAVEVLRINRPEARNALSPAVIAGIGAAVAEADADPAVGAVVITGTGDRAFCAGMDLRAFAAGRDAGGEGSTPAQADAAAGMAAYQRFIREGAAKPVVAAANGAAVAGGFELLLACDMAVAAEEARFGLPEVKRALFPAGGGVFLSRRIPLAQAFELTLTGDLIDAPAAMALGLVNKVVPADRVLDEAIALAERVTANGPLAVRVTKRLVRAAASSPPDDVWALQDELRDSVFGSEDAKEGATAFVERRAPQWKGR